MGTSAPVAAPAAAGAPSRGAPLRIALAHQRHAAVGGTERFLNALAAFLAERGHAVVIVCRRHEAAPHERVRFERLRGFALGSSWRLWRFSRDLERHLERADYDVVLGLGKTVTQDVIRAGGGCHQTYIDAASRWTRRPWERWLGLGRIKNRLALELERRAYSPARCGRVITNSKMVQRDIIARHGVPERSISVIYNGVDLRRFSPRNREEAGAELRRRLGFLPEHCVLLFLGRGFGRKGLDRALEAFARIRDARPSARLLVAGHDRRRPAYERLAGRLGLADVVRFVGERGDPESCYGAADLYVLPTRYDPFAFSVIEALASGLPVVTTDGNGASELIDASVGSVVSAGGDAGELAAALLHWTEPGRAAGARPAARALAERHPFEATLGATEAVLLEAAASRAASAAPSRGAASAGAPPRR